VVASIQPYDSSDHHDREQRPSRWAEIFDRREMGAELTTTVTAIQWVIVEIALGVRNQHLGLKL
jgi:hypothetical protein